MLMAEVNSIDLNARRVSLAGQSLEYDYLVVATGATHAYLGRDDWARHVMGLKSLDDALAIRARILTAFEQAELETDPQSREAWLTFVIVGAGPTGVELAGTLAEIARHTWRRSSDAAIHARPGSADRSGRAAVGEFFAAPFGEGGGAAGASRCHVADGLPGHRDRRRLHRIGRRTHCLVHHTLGCGRGGIAVRADAGHSFGSRRSRDGAADLSLADHSEVFVAGDLASISCDRKPVPGIAPAAKQMGAHAAKCIAASIKGRPRVDFRYRDFGNLATIGRRAAVVDIRGYEISGTFAWFFWLAAHIFFLIGFRNRLVVLIDWAWAYFTYDRSARIIVRS